MNLPAYLVPIMINRPTRKTTCKNVKMEGLSSRYVEQRSSAHNRQLCKFVSVALLRLNSRSGVLVRLRTKWCTIKIFSNLAQISAIYRTFKMCNKKMGFTVVVFALCACNSECFFPNCARSVRNLNNRQKFLFYTEQTLWAGYLNQV